MPRDEEDIIDAAKKAAEKLKSIRLNSFTAEPKEVRPLNNVTLSWDATPDSQVKYKLLGRTVPNSGTLTIRPVRTTSFTLYAEYSIAKSPLGTVTVQVDLSDCYVIAIGQAELASEFRKDLVEEYPEEEGKKIELDLLPNLIVRAKKDLIRLTADTGGIKFAGELDVEINNAPDGTLKFDGLVAV